MYMKIVCIDPQKLMPIVYLSGEEVRKPAAFKC